MRYSDEQLLKIVGEERKRSIGFGEGDTGDLLAARTKALQYYKGDMRDIPLMPNRSQVVDTAVADAIETVLPDVMEVFVGGEDVATFVPMSQEDEERAQEETEFVNHVVFVENDGFLALYTAMKDAFLTRTGVLHWWWEEEEKEEPAAAEPMSEAMANVVAMGQAGMEAEDAGDGMVTLKNRRLHGRVCVRAFPSEDFTVATDTVNLKDATYCAVRDRPRVQDLIARGVDAEKARALKSYTTAQNQISQDRDEAGETQQTSGDATGDLRVVETRMHFIRLAMQDEGKLSIWRVLTDSEETTLLEKEEVDAINFAALTPYIVPHRFYGESVADKLIEVQKIKTALLRMLMDSGWFALNQRNYVDMNKVNEYTLADLMANEPGRPVRGDGEGAVTPLAAGALTFDVFAAMEYVNTMAESRSGIVRNAQGLNPDTLHDTAKGAMALIAAAQKRVRMIARIFAETGVKDMFIGVHRMLRSGYGKERAEGEAQLAPANAKLGKGWAQVNPTDWPERCNMTVHVGVGSAGREHDMMIANTRIELMQGVITEQGGLNGPIVDGKNAYAALREWERAAGSKKAELFWSNPEDAPPQPPQPDPETMKVQGQLALEREKATANVQLTREKAQVDAETMAQKHQMDAQAAEAQAQRDHALKVAQMNAEMDLKREQIAAELQLKREQLAAELDLKRQLGFAQAAVAHETGMAKVNASTSQVEPGGEPG